VIALNEQHLKRLLTDYVRYYHEDRTHLGLAKLRCAEYPRRTMATFSQRRDSAVCTIATTGQLNKATIYPLIIDDERFAGYLCLSAGDDLIRSSVVAKPGRERPGRDLTAALASALNPKNGGLGRENK
jgi:hypothetical protein